jgi:hypothetical protein
VGRAKARAVDTTPEPPANSAPEPEDDDATVATASAQRAAR